VQTHQFSENGMNDPAACPIDPDLFDLLVCPESRMLLKWVGGRLVSTDAKTRRAYRIEAGIPVMLIGESQILGEAEWKGLMAQAGPCGGGAAAVKVRQALPPPKTP
jgi:uncharacterized protein YbaR (Trm112 family)